MVETSRECSWLPDYEQVLAGKTYFLRDYCNLKESDWARGRVILADRGVETIFTEFCRRYPEPKLDPNFEARLSQVQHFSTEKIAELARSSRQHIWLSSATTITGCAALNPEQRQIVGMFDYVAVAAGSAFNAGYYGIHLCRVVRDWPNFLDHEIARFYGGCVYENKALLARLRAEGCDV